MRRIISQFLVLLIFAPNLFANEDGNNSSSEIGNVSIAGKSHYGIGLVGNSALVLDKVDNYRIISVRILPFPTKSGPGISVDYTSRSTGNYEDNFINVQPSLQFSSQYVLLKAGLNIIKITEGEGPGGLALPGIEIGMGKINRFYFSAGLLSELYNGLAWIKANYCFANKSSIEVGRAFGGGPNDVTYLCKIDFDLYNTILVRFGGIVNFEKEHSCLQVGVGFIF